MEPVNIDQPFKPLVLARTVPLAQSDLNVYDIQASNSYLASVSGAFQLHYVGSPGSPSVVISAPVNGVSTVSVSGDIQYVGGNQIYVTAPVNGISSVCVSGDVSYVGGNGIFVSAPNGSFVSTISVTGDVQYVGGNLVSVSAPSSAGISTISVTGADALYVHLSSVENISGNKTFLSPTINTSWSQATSFRSALVSVSGSYVVTDTVETVWCSSTGTITLPAANVAGAGYTRPVFIVNRGVGTVTVAPAGADTIEGSGSITLASGVKAMLMSDSVSDWRRWI